MWLRELEVDRLRNLKAVSVELPAGFTVIVGQNGQGKSSLLEAIYLLGTGRSFRTRRQDELVSWNGGPSRIAGSVDSRVGRSRLAVLMDDGERHLVADGSEKDLAAYLGRLDVVDLTGERMKVLRGGPEERRRFLDRGVVGLSSGYLDQLGAYRKVLQHRNALIRRAAGSVPRQLDAWDERLVIVAGVLHRARRRYAVRLAALAGELGRAVFPTGRELRMTYRPSPEAAGSADIDDFEEIFKAEVARGRAKDLSIGHTCRGPHRDELRIELDEVDLRRFGSAGQVRVAMIALKLAKLSLLKEERGEAPLFLMDDFDTDLDDVRASALADHLIKGSFQALVASSKESLIAQLGVTFTKVRMHDGEARAA